MNKTLKPRRCAVCKEEYIPKRIGLKITKVCLNAGCVLDYAQGVKAKEADKSARKRKKEFLNDDKSFQKAKAQKAFNEFIRLRDSAEGCISCEKPCSWTGQWHAGHYKTVGARADLRFNEDNVHKQCSVCNNYLSGNLVNYRNSLIDKIGMGRVLDLETEWKPTKYNAEDYRKIYKKYSEKVKELKSAKNLEITV